MQHPLRTVGDVEAVASITAAPGGLHRVQLDGPFAHPHWLAFLCGGLSAAGVAVVSGVAVRPEPLCWTAHFLVSGPVEGLDVVALAGRRPPRRDATVPHVTSYDVTRQADGQLSLTVEAADSLGFLGRLLSRISLLTLLPSALEISTERGRISDRFVLSGIGSAAPSEEVHEALQGMLAGMTAVTA
jgi:hypothetical protein